MESIDEMLRRSRITDRTRMQLQRDACASLQGLMHVRAGQTLAADSFAGCLARELMAVDTDFAGVWRVQ